MPALQWGAILPLPFALSLAQLLAWAFARGLGVRLPRRVMAAGLLLPCLLLAPWLAGDRLLAPTDEPIAANVPGAPRVADPDPHGLLNDAVFQLLPWETEVRRALRAGRAPLWSDLLDGGSSPWVNPQAGVLSPVAWLARLFPIEHSLLGALAVKMLLAAEGAWLLARLLGAGRTAALLAGASFALAGPIQAWGIFPLSPAVAWVPWVAAGAVRLLRRPAPRRIAATALATAALLLSGHPETAALGGLFAACCSLAFRRRRLPLRRGLAAAAVAALLGAGLAAPHLLPFVRILPGTQRSAASFDGPSTPLRLAAPSTWFSPPRAAFLQSPFNPRAFGRPYREPFRGPGNRILATAGYAGLTTLAGSAAGLGAALAGRRRRRIVLSLFAFAAGSFLLASGYLHLPRLLHALPPLRAVAFSRLLPIAGLALILAGALGLDALLRRPRPKAVWVALAAAAAASLAIHFDAWILLTWALIFAGAFVAPRSRRAAALLLAAAVALDLLPWARDLQPAGHRELFYPRTPLVETIAKTAGDGRAVAQGRLLYPSLLAAYGIADVRAHNPVAPIDQLRVLEAAFGFRPESRRYKGTFRGLDHPLLDFLGARARVAPLPLPPGTRRGRRPPPLAVRAATGALPRCFLATGADVVPNAQVLAAVPALRDPRRPVLATEEAGAWRPASRQSSLALRILEARPGALRLALPATPGEKLLATSFPYPAGWQARANGEPLRRLTVNGAYAGFVVPAATTRVDLRFTPPGLYPGLLLALLAAIAITLLTVRSAISATMGAETFRYNRRQTR